MLQYEIIVAIETRAQRRNGEVDLLRESFIVV